MNMCRLKHSGKPPKNIRWKKRCSVSFQISKISVNMLGLDDIRSLETLAFDLFTRLLYVSFTCSKYHVQCAGLVWVDWQLWVWFGLTDNYGFGLGWPTIMGSVWADWQLWVWFGLTDNYGLNPSHAICDNS